MKKLLLLTGVFFFLLVALIREIYFFPSLDLMPNPDTAWLLADAFGTSPEFWSNLQTTHDLSLHRPERHVGPLVSVES